MRRPPRYTLSSSSAASDVYKRQEYEKLRAGSDEDKKKASKMELISVDEFNKLEYPLALLFEQYAILDKEYTSYYKPMLEDNLESKIFKSYSLARIETRRIMIRHRQ